MEDFITTELVTSTFDNQNVLVGSSISVPLIISSDPLDVLPCSSNEDSMISSLINLIESNYCPFKQTPYERCESTYKFFGTLGSSINCISNSLKFLAVEDLSFSVRRFQHADIMPGSQMFLFCTLVDRCFEGMGDKVSPVVLIYSVDIDWCLNKSVEAVTGKHFK